jgi:hypothetical protein
MAEDPVPSPAEIMDLARDIVRFAVIKRGGELRHADEKDDPNDSGFYNTLRTQYAWVVDDFAEAVALTPYPNDLDPLIEVMKTGDRTLVGGSELHLAGVNINGQLTASAGKLTDPFWSESNAISTKVADWTGDAADGFRKSFVSALSTVPANQSVAFRSLNLAMLAAKRVYEQYLRDLGELATKVRAALHPVGFHCPGASLQAVVGLAAGLSKIFAGLATIEDGGGFVVVEGGMQLFEVATELAKEGEGDKYSVDGPTVESILQSLQRVLTEITGLVAEHEQSIVDIINANNDSLASPGDAPYYVVPKPTVVDLSNVPLQQLWNEFD